MKSFYYGIMLACLLLAMASQTYPYQPEYAVCSNVTNYPLIKSTGYNYVESNVAYLMPDKSDDEFQAHLDEIKYFNASIISCTSFIPGSLTLTGPEAKQDEALVWADSALRRASMANIPYIVFGSGKARNIPENFSREQAIDQFVSFCKQIAPLAEKYEVTIVIEPLNRLETNLINSLEEGAKIVEAVDHPNVQLLCDIYHMMREEEPASAIVKYGKYIRHCHIAEKEERTSPGTKGDNFRPYFSALKEIGYKGCISIECKWQDFQNEIKPALAYMQEQWAVSASSAVMHVSIPFVAHQQSLKEKKIATDIIKTCDGESDRERLCTLNPIVVHTEIIKNPVSVPSAHASTIVETDNGLLVAWFGGTYERHPDVSIYTSRFKDGHWSDPVMVADGVQNESQRFPCWNPVLFKRENGDLILYYKVGPSPSTWWGEYKVSTDEGEIWSASKVIPRGCLGPIKNKPVTIPGEKILYPTSIEIVGKWNVYMEMSNQDLTDWEKIEIDNNGFDAIQPSVLFHENGALQILCRSKNEKVVESWSYDNGKTWSRLSLTELPNNNSGIDAVSLSNGLQLIVYNPITSGRNKLAIAGSIDGKTWEKLIDIEDHLSGEFSYPAMIQDKNGNIHLTYTYNRERIKYVQLKF